MKIEKAIEILDIPPGQHGFFLTTERLEAIKLGIEALRRIQGLRLYGLVPAGCELWGETKD